MYLELAAACGAPPLLELDPGRARLGGQVWGRGGGGAARRTSSRCVTICHEVMSWLWCILCDYVMSALRGDQARTARCLRRGSAARRDQELPPARVCRAPISGTIALLNIHLQICTTSGEWFGSQISDSNTFSLEWKCCPIGFWLRFQPKNLSIDWDREQLLYI